MADANFEFGDYGDDFERLARGYIEMSQLNREIVQEFTLSEAEAELKLFTEWN